MTAYFVYLHEFRIFLCRLEEGKPLQPTKCSSRDLLVYPWLTSLGFGQLNLLELLWWRRCLRRLLAAPSEMLLFSHKFIPF